MDLKFSGPDHRADCSPPTCASNAATPAEGSDFLLALRRGVRRRESLYGRQARAASPRRCERRPGSVRERGEDWRVSGGSGESAGVAAMFYEDATAAGVVLD